MATTYAALKTEIADFYNRTDLTSVIDTFIDFCESELQVRCKQLEFEADTTLTVTAGLATLPSGWLGARTLIWQSNPKRHLRYKTPDQLEQIKIANEPGIANYYTITGSSLKFADDTDGTVVVTYSARFTPLSDSNTTNAILTSFPAAYLYGSLKHAAAYCKDEKGVIGYATLFDEQVKAIIRDNAQRKLAGATLEVRPA